MIEYCNKKIMMTTIGGLIFICVLILYLEDVLIEHPVANPVTSNEPLLPGAGPPQKSPGPTLGPAAQGKLASFPSPSPAVPPGQLASNRSSSCRPVGDCIPCSQFDLRMSNANLSPYCVSGYKRRLVCPDGAALFGACSAPENTAATERGRFFLFQALCLLALLASGTFVQRRQRRLNQIFAEKINKQVASGV